MSLYLYRIMSLYDYTSYRFLYFDIAQGYICQTV